MTDFQPEIADNGRFRETVAVTVPAGRYWLGDPCYAVADTDWDRWLDDGSRLSGHAFGSLGGNVARVLAADVHGHPVVGVGTEYGDGSYDDEHGNSFPVDAGMIGLTHVTAKKIDEPFGSILVELAEPTRVWWGDDGGTIHIGELHAIKTAPIEPETCGDCSCECGSCDCYVGTCPDCLCDESGVEEDDED